MGKSCRLCPKTSEPEVLQGLGNVDNETRAKAAQLCVECAVARPAYIIPIQTVSKSFIQMYLLYTNTWYSSQILNFEANHQPLKVRIMKHTLRVPNINAVNNSLYKDWFNPFLIVEDLQTPKIQKPQLKHIKAWESFWVERSLIQFVLIAQERQ